MSGPVGFVPPVPLPALGGAANLIIPTGGLLGGAAAGARAGAILGPKGVLAGALLGGLLGGLLLPSPLAPGTLPGLDPGLNPEPTPEPEPQPRPDTPPTPIPVPDGKDGQVLQWEITYTLNETYPEHRWCPPPLQSGGLISGEQPTYTSPVKKTSFTAEKLSIELLQGYQHWSCGTEGLVENKTIYAMVVYFTGGPNDGLLAYRERVNRSRSFDTDVNDPGRRTWIDIVGITADSEPVPNPFLPPPPPPKPRPEPIPLIPLPEPQPKPAPVPIPEPQPQPEPLITPSPNRPTAPPVTIPKAPPAVPQAPPEPSPFPIPGPGPRPTVPIPQPIPGVPTVPEPSPDPNVVPAPGPAPNPAPGPRPNPDPDPEPGTTPLPQPNPVPAPNRPTIPTVPDTSIPTVPDGSLAPRPTPKPVPIPPNVHFPVPGGPGVTPGGTRPDVSAIAAEIGRVEQKLAGLANKPPPQLDLGDLIPLLGLLSDLLEQPIPGTTYSLTGVCEDVGTDEEQPETTWQIPDALNFAAVIARLDTMDAMLQQHLAWRTPTCKRPTLQGDWRTITFISDEASGTRGDRLRKRFRYRSLNGLGLPQVIDHWANFTWQAGAVCVQHAGATWGTPQVWAASIDEGKRVIRHAAGEAGIDPDKNGRWVISGSSSARVGLPGTMRVCKKGGYYWITARDGPDGSPIVGSTP